MKYNESLKKLRFKMLLTKEITIELDIFFANINRWRIGKYIPTMMTRSKLQHYFKKYDIEVDE